MTQIYACFLNGKLYGKGNLAYMNDLFRDRVVDCEMYGKDDVTFRVTTVEKMREIVKEDE
ncbi:hypothetical protein ABH16_04750 [Bacillus altitudinis]|uniref:hypothetical protein n=1 Tax=Bacillus altitudinis TaxID=293387 RepID=UPI0018CE2D33|nr:hypothetical protein [Bacillus altitudinis]MBG9901837.1 hypothetical protein [Bacillus altitudinis]